MQDQLETPKSYPQGVFVIPNGTSCSGGSITPGGAIGSEVPTSTVGQSWPTRCRLEPLPLGSAANTVTYDGSCWSGVADPTTGGGIDILVLPGSSVGKSPTRRLIPALLLGLLKRFMSWHPSSLSSRYFCPGCFESMWFFRRSCLTCFLQDTHLTFLWDHGVDILDKKANGL